MIFLSVTAQRHIETSHSIILCVATLLNLISLFFLIHDTPPNQAKIRNYLLLTQVIVIVNVIYMDLLFSPIPIFPAPGGICSGLLIKAGISVPPILGGLIITYAWLALSMYMCCFFRHQSLLPETASVGKNKSRLLLSSLFLALATPSAIYGAIPFDLSQIDNLLIRSPYDLAWVIDREWHFIHDRSATVIFFSILLVMVLIAILFLFLATFFHMYYVLNRDIVVPLIMLVIPGAILFTSVACERISFEVNLFIFLLVLLHPIVHNLILLGITPTYRRLIVSIPRRLLGKYSTSQSLATVSTIARYR